MQLTEEQIKEGEKILSFYKSKDKEIKKMSKVLFSDFLKNLKIDHLYVAYITVYRDYYGRIEGYSNNELIKITDIVPSVVLYLITNNPKYLSKGSSINGNTIYVNGGRKYKREFYTKVTV